MPENIPQWCFFGFFLLGAAGGWLALISTVRLKLMDMRAGSRDSEWLVTEDDLSPPPKTEVRTRANLPTYTPRKKDT